MAFLYLFKSHNWWFFDQFILFILNLKVFLYLKIN